MHHDLVDVLIIEDESELARLHAELVQKHPRLRLAGMAASLAQARQLLHATPPQLVLLDNYLPDGKGAGDQPMLGDLYHRRQRYGNLQPGHPQRRLRLYP